METIELVESESNTKRFQCNWCDKSFNRPCDFQRHKRIHTNERPHPCTDCGKSFIQKSALTVHIRKHTGEQPHQCKHVGCGKRFSDSSSFARHRRIHTGERPYKCEYRDCTKSYSRRLTLSKHHRRDHQLSVSLSSDSSISGHVVKPQSLVSNSPTELNQQQCNGVPIFSRPTLEPHTTSLSGYAYVPEVSNPRVATLMAVQNFELPCQVETSQIIPSSPSIYSSGSQASLDPQDLIYADQHLLMPTCIDNFQLMDQYLVVSYPMPTAEHPYYQSLHNEWSENVLYQHPVEPISQNPHSSSAAPGPSNSEDWRVA